MTEVNLTQELCHSQERSSPVLCVKDVGCPCQPIFCQHLAEQEPISPYEQLLPVTLGVDMSIILLCCCGSQPFGRIAIVRVVYLHLVRALQRRHDAFALHHAAKLRLHDAGKAAALNARACVDAK